jgi:hypothetical protein
MLEAAVTLLVVVVEVQVAVEEITLLQSKETILEELGLVDKFLSILIKSLSPQNIRITTRRQSADFRK